MTDSTVLAGSDQTDIKNMYLAGKSNGNNDNCDDPLKGEVTIHCQKIDNNEQANNSDKTGLENGQYDSQIDSSQTSNANAYNNNKPLSGSVIKNAIGVVRSLPVGRKPDYVIGQFLEIYGSNESAINGPGKVKKIRLGQDLLSKWHGSAPDPCYIRLIKLPDNSGGYYFKTTSPPLSGDTFNVDHGHWQVSGFLAPLIMKFARSLHKPKDKNISQAKSNPCGWVMPLNHSYDLNGIRHWGIFYDQ